MRVTISRNGRHAGFGRLDLMAVLAVLLGAVALLSAIIFRLHHPSTQIRCTNNLRELGVAMALYEEDSDERLPYAYIKAEKDDDQNSRAWDQLIFPLIPLNSAGLQQKHLFRCPADTIARSGDRPQRTYAMPIHTMTGDTWPPGPDDSTGVGLFWEAGRGGLADVTNVISPQATAGDKPKSSIPAIRLGVIPAPAETLLLTENARPANILFTPSAAGISGPGQHVQSRLIDGHVEFLYPWESAGLSDPNSTGSRKSHANVWTIRADD